MEYFRNKIIIFWLCFLSWETCMVYKVDLYCLRFKEKGKGIYFEYFAILKLEGSGCRVGRRVQREENQEPFYQNIDLTAVLFKHTDKHTHTHIRLNIQVFFSRPHLLAFFQLIRKFCNKNKKFVDFPAFMADF